VDWNAAKSACHRAVIEGTMGPMESWEDRVLGELRPRFPGWDIWYVHHAGQRRNTWCARPKGAPVAVFHAWDSAELVVKISRAESEVGKP
jgi:hypothetical protein